MSNVKVIYLTTGEQLVGNVELENSESIVIEHPMAFVQQSIEKFGFMNYISPISNDESVEIKHVDIRHVLEPTDEVKAHWEETFGSGLVLPAGPRLITE